MDLLLTTSYLPPIEYIAAIAYGMTLHASDGVIPSVIYLEDCENYQKQSWRNRARIYGANGPLDLNIPVVHPHGVGRAGVTTGGRLRTATVDVDLSKDWIHQHKRALMSAYKTTAFYDHYSEGLFHILDTLGTDKLPESQSVVASSTSLLRMNTLLLEYILHAVGIDAEIHTTSELFAGCTESRTDMPSKESLGMPSKESLGMTSEESLGMTSEVSLGMASEESLDMASEVSQDMASEESLGMASKESLYMASEKSQGMTYEVSQDMDSEESLGMTSEESQGMTSKESLYMTPEVGESVPDGPFKNLPIVRTPQGNCLVDLREVFHPKHTNDILKRLGLQKEYYQVFSPQHGFQAHLSSVDLLFNYGPESLDFLKKKGLDSL